MNKLIYLILVVLILVPSSVLADGWCGEEVCPDLDAPPPPDWCQQPGTCMPILWCGDWVCPPLVVPPDDSQGQVTYRNSQKTQPQTYKTVGTVVK